MKAGSPKSRASTSRFLCPNGCPDEKAAKLHKTILLLQDFIPHLTEYSRGAFVFVSPKWGQARDCRDAALQSQIRSVALHAGGRTKQNIYARMEPCGCSAAYINTRRTTFAVLLVCPFWAKLFSNGRFTETCFPTTSV